MAPWCLRTNRRWRLLAPEAVLPLLKVLELLGEAMRQQTASTVALLLSPSPTALKTSMHGRKVSLDGHYPQRAGTEQVQGSTVHPFAASTDDLTVRKPKGGQVV